MKSREEKQKIWTVYEADRPTHINSKTMRILSLIPEFQRDVARIRETPSFLVLKSQIDIYNRKNDKSDAIDVITVINEWFRSRGFSVFSSDKERLIFNKFENDPFIEAVKRISEKFCLPNNFYNNVYSFLPCYILTGRVQITSEIIGRFNNKNTRIRVKEFEDTFELIKKSLGGSIKHDSPDDYYMSLLKKKNIKLDSESKAMRKLEKLPTTYKTKNKNIKMTKIAKEFGKKSNTLIKARKRLDGLAKDLFGYGILE